TTIDALIDTIIATLGAKDTAAATGAVSGAKLAMAYIKQLVTELQALDAIVDTLAIDTDPKVMGKLQVATMTWDLLRGGAGAGTDVLFTGNTEAVIIEAVIVRMPASPDLTNDPFTSIAIATDDAEPGIIIDTTTGDIAKLTAEAQLAWTGAMYIAVGTEIEGTLAGDDADEESLITIIVKYRAVVSGGYLYLRAYC
ncbi:unnamed protein product, partial [marine sediment metagenome]